jgi:AcrR family transcriptional regulator
MSKGSPARRDELLEVAHKVLERDGLEHFSIGEIARAAGIKVPSLYKQFLGKADIEERLIVLGFRLQGETTARAIAALGASPSRRMVVEILVRAYRDFGLRHPQLYRLMHERPLPVSLPMDVYLARAVDYRRLFSDRTIETSFWAWAHGVLSLELAGRYELDVDIEGLWQVLTDRLVEEIG